MIIFSFCRLLIAFLILGMPLAELMAGRGEDDVIPAPCSRSIIDPSVKVSYKRGLCLDGGGVRGVFSARVLENLLADMQANGDERHLHDLFKGGVTGTSTGSFIALALVAPKHKDQEGNWQQGPYAPSAIVDFYEDMGKQVFAKCDPCLSQGCFRKIFTCWRCCYCCGGLCGPKHGRDRLRTALEDRFGDMALGEAISPVQIITYDIEQHAPKKFTSVANAGMRFVDAALASSAAPSYFPGYEFQEEDRHHHRCVDGGLYENSATLSASLFVLKNYVNEFPQENTHVDDITLLSIGTGEVVKEGRFKRLKHAGKLGWAANAVETSIVGAAQGVHANLTDIFDMRANLTKETSRYYRIQTKLLGSEAVMDNPKNIAILKSKADALTKNRPFDDDYKRFLAEQAYIPTLRLEFLRSIDSLQYEEEMGTFV